MKFPITQFREAARVIPQSISIVFESDKTGELIHNIGTHNQLSESGIGLLSDQVAYVLVGLLKPEQFHDSVIRELNLRPSETDEIVTQINQQIFQHIQLDLAKLAAMGAPKFTEESTTTQGASRAPSPATSPMMSAPTPAPSSWNISAGPIVTEAYPKVPRTTDAPLQVPISTTAPAEIAPSQVPPGTASPLPPPPKEELVTPHKGTSQHTSNMPGMMRHPWLSDPVKLPATAAPIPTKPPVEKAGKFDAPKLQPTAFAAPTAPNQKNPQAQLPKSVVPTVLRAPMAPLVSAPTSAEIKEQKPVAPPTLPAPINNIDATKSQEISSAVIMPGKGVNIPIPKMVSRLPIEERESSRITIVRKSSMETQSAPMASPNKQKAIDVPPLTTKTSAPTLTEEKIKAGPVVAPATPSQDAPQKVPISAAHGNIQATPATKIPTPGSASTTVVYPAKAGLTPQKQTEQLYTGKDPYREPVN